MIIDSIRKFLFEILTLSKKRRNPSPNKSKVTPKPGGETGLRVESPENSSMINQSIPEKSTTHLIAEYEYLNELTILRVKTAHFIWMGSIAAGATTIGIGLERESWILLISLPLLLVPLMLSIAYQLDSICRIRTYIAEILEPQLGIYWERYWPHLSRIEARSIISLTGVPRILSIPFILSTSVSVLLAYSYWPHEHKLLSFFPVSFCILSCFFWSIHILFDSYSLRRFRDYRDDWISVRIKLGTMHYPFNAEKHSEFT